MFEVKVIKGRIWKFGDNIDTDLIAPGKYLGLPYEQLLEHILEPANPDFPKKVQKGDIIIGGKNFGCGSSREQAPRGLKDLGVGAIVAESFARIFFRNCIGIGLPALTSSSISKHFETGHEAEVDLRNGTITNLTTGKTLETSKLPDMMLEILETGGVLEMLKQGKL